MQAWWRVLRGLYPYRFSVVLSILCALGVGLSYASGVAIMLPVMKIFVSTEGVHGWANRTAAEKRLDLQILDYDTTVRREDKDVGRAPEARPAESARLLITSGGSAAHPGLKPSGAVYLQIKAVHASVPSANGWGPEDATSWKRMVWVLAHAQPGTPVTLTLAGPTPGESVAVTATPADLRFYTRGFIAIVDSLPADAWQALWWVVGFFIFLCVVGSIFRYVQQFLGMSIANRVVMDLRRRMYDQVVQLPTSFFAQKGTSDTMSRLTQDTGTLTDGVAMAMGKAVQEPIKALFAFGLAWWLDWRLTLGVVLIMPPLAIIIHKFSKRMRRAARRALENWARMLAIINETLIGARVVKAYSAEGYERRRFTRVNKDLLKEQIKLNHYASLSRPTIETLAVALVSIPMMFAAYYVLRGTIDKEAFFTLLACFAAMIEPLRKLADVNAKVQQTNAAATRVFEIIDLPPEPNHKHSLPHLARHEKDIEFKDITFSYPGHEEVVLRHVSFRVRAGQSVAIVGGNGSGKTTLLSLLPRLYVPTSGTVLIDGTDAGTVSLRSLRKQIGLVTQDTLLFADTIFNNIAYGTRHATPEQVFDAARRAYADEFIREFPEGYATRVGEHGVRLSGGQKQRLAIARAILHDPAILILDEAMSQIDSDSEAKIALALKDFTRSRTTFMIAHRFSTVVGADLIVCLDGGKVAGLGTHPQLLNACPVYRKLYENQFREGGWTNVVPANGDVTPAPADHPAPVGGK